MVRVGEAVAVAVAVNVGEKVKVKTVVTVGVNVAVGVGEFVPVMNMVAKASMVSALAVPLVAVAIPPVFGINKSESGNLCVPDPKATNGRPNAITQVPRRTTYKRYSFVFTSVLSSYQ